MHDPGFDLTGRKALVTGASAGIGAAIATRLAAAGAQVVGVSRSGTVPGDLGGGEVPDGKGSIHGLVADLTDAAALDEVVVGAVDLLGGLDIVVNNAGRGDWKPVSQIDREYFDDLVHLNLWAPLRLSQLAHEYLAVADHAAVVMIGSVDAQRPSAGGVVYGATKAALAAATVALAKEWGLDGIRVNQVNPGLVDTPMAEAVVEALNESGERINLAGRAGTPDEVAGLVHYLVAPIGRYANGASFTVDGGALALGPFDARGEA